MEAKVFSNLFGLVAYNNKIFQNYKPLRHIINAPWFVSNETIHAGVGFVYVKYLMQRFS